jgi:stage II sporulation protein AA (anti-sigma F factor antagonist)
MTVKLTGELDHSSATRIREELDNLISDPGVKRLVFDMNELCFMDSSGIGVILGRYKTMIRRGGTVAVKAGNRQIDRIFELSGLYQIIEKLA